MTSATSKPSFIVSGLHSDGDENFLVLRSVASALCTYDALVLYRYPVPTKIHENNLGTSYLLFFSG